MARNVGHICSMNDKYCSEGANPARHPDHNSHMGGCICKLGDGEVHECDGECVVCDEAQRLPEWVLNVERGNPLWSFK